MIDPTPAGQSAAYAVIKTGGKQLRVRRDQVVRVEKLDQAPGEQVIFPEVLMHHDGQRATFARDQLAQVQVSGQVMEIVRTPKVLSFTKRRRKHSRRLRGHRQTMTLVRITDITAGAG